MFPTLPALFENMFLWRVSVDRNLAVSMMLGFALAPEVSGSLSGPGPARPL